MMQRVLDILARQKLIDIPVQIDGLTVQVNVQSPLAREEDVSDLEALTQWIQLMQQVEPRLPMLGAKVEELPQWIGTKLGVDQELLRPQSEVKKATEMIGATVGAQASEAVAPSQAGAGGQAEAPPPQATA